MAGATYDVRATLLMQARGAYGEVRRVAGEVRQLGESIKTNRNAFREMVGQALAFGAAYVGFRAVSNAITGLTKSAVAYTSELEANKIGLQSVLSAVENTDWETAGRRATAAFGAIREMAIKSPATSAEMFQIFNGIVGPVEAAGFGMQKVLDLTGDTTLASAALGVDYQQASRDINMMVRGTAGMEVKLFSMLRSTGAIKEDAEAWNKTLTGTQRVEKLSEALKKFAKGGAAFGSSWKGVTSTLTDIFDNLKATAFAPILKVMGRNLERFNGYILQHRVEIETFLLNVGRDMGNKIGNLFMKAELGFRYVLEHWDQIVDRFNRVVTKVKEVAPLIARAALAWELANMGRNVVGGALSAGAGISNALSGAGELGLGLGLGAGKASKAAAPALAMSMAANPFGMMGAGGMAMTSPFGMWGAGAAAGATGAATSAAGGGGMAAITASLVAMGPVLVVVAAAMAALLAIGLAFADQWKNMATIFGETGGQTLTLLLAFAKTLWDTLAPVLKLIGSVLLIPLTALWVVFSTALRAGILALTAWLKVMGEITAAIYAAVKPAFDFIFGLFKQLAEWINNLFAQAASWLQSIGKGPKGETVDGPSHDPNTDFSRWSAKAPLASTALDLSKAPKGAVNINQDFRGSRISVKQEFKGDQDPDRIVMAMMNDLTRQAENRVSSGYSGALTR